MLVLVDCAAESVVSAYVQVGDAVGIGNGCGDRAQRSGLTHCLVRAVLVVVGLELAQAAP